jgi:hypothetical protein
MSILHDVSSRHHVEKHFTALRDSNRHSVDRVIPVTELIPLSLFGLSAAGQVRGTGAQDNLTGLLNPGEQLPPLPAVSLPLADKTRVLPGATSHTYFDAGDRRGA